MLTLKHLRTLQHVLILTEHHQGVRRCNKIWKLFINILSTNRLIFMKINLLLLNILINNFQILLQLCCHITTIDF